MKKTSLAFISMAALLVQSASAQLLFTTYEDFLQWQSANGFTAVPVTNPDSDGGNVNGLGNTNAFGAAGTGGALQVQWPQGGIPYNYPVGSPGEQGFTNFIAVLKQPGKVLTFDYRAPTNVTGGTTGTYFTVGVTVNCQGRFDQLLPTSTASLGGGWTRASIDWSTEAGIIVTQEVTNAGTFSYFQLLMIYNSDYNPTTPFYIDNFVMRDAPGTPAKLYTTTNDFTGWSAEAGFTNVVSTNLDLDGLVTNGVGNLTAPGAVGTGGSLQIVHLTNNFGAISFAPYEQSNTAFVAALLHASTVTFDYTTPATGTGTYFQAGIAVDYDGHFDQLFPSTTPAVVSGSVNRASIDWVSEAQALAVQYAAGTNSFGYLRIGILWNSDYGPDTTPFQVDNITAITNSPAPYLIPASSNLVSETCSPGNGGIDPGETVSVGFALQNTGNQILSNVVATLLATGGVSSPSGAQSYGTLLSGGGAATNSFTFTANGTCGDPLIATLQIQTNSVFYRTIPYGFRLGTLGTAATNEYSSGGISVGIPDNDTNGATSSITVPQTGSVAKVVVRLRINHTFDGDLRLDLVHPDGTVIGLIAPNPGNGGANFGSGATDCTGTFTVFDDSAATPIAAGTSPYTGSFKPRQALSALNGKASQGTWTLKATDTAPGDSGTIYCFQLQITEQPFSCCSGGPADPFTTWQSQYFAGGGSNPNAAPGADPDADGMNNTNEFLAGFNPTNNAAYLHIINVSKSGTNIVVTYLGANGNSTTTPPMASRTNVLEFTTGTANGSYSNNFASTGQSNVLSGGTGLGTITSFVDTNGASGATKYYRVRVLVP